MKAVTYACVATASLIVLMVVYSSAGQYLPRVFLFHLWVESEWFILVWFYLYVASLLVLVLSLLVLGLNLSGVLQMRRIVGLERIVLTLSGAVIVIFCVSTSVFLFLLSKATGL